MAVSETNVSPAPVTVYGVVVGQVRPAKPRTALDTMLSIQFSTVPKQSFSIHIATPRATQFIVPYSSNLEKLRHMFSVTLTIQRPYMALQENLVTFFPRH